ncbi:MAG: AbrB/MazE/SpoVT family DNA-binding domain-containing protein [Candidatus Bathyarchaeota archaeon]|nr:AbrB/MazE/SpoVT family DNA-binding domain-containing protein [Candidatus Bathyarchaeota archaeon]MDH5663794.1 AbrB/MazE/SpoVT family DNA-binding domain-containing protein [Candidatus Bathyarchaeota archaeon]
MWMFVLVEEFVAWVFKGGKVTIPKRVRELLDVGDGDYVRLSLVDPGSVGNVTVFIRNEGNAVVILSMNTTNWNPSNASNFVTLSWDYGGQMVDPEDVVEVTFMLSVSSSVEAITDFSFDIVIVGSG